LILEVGDLICLITEFFPLIPLPIKEAVEDGLGEEFVTNQFPLIPLPIKEAVAPIVNPYPA
jgi:hypothetical protein